MIKLTVTMCHRTSCHVEACRMNAMCGTRAKITILATVVRPCTLEPSEVHRADTGVWWLTSRCSQQLAREYHPRNARPPSVVLQRINNYSAFGTLASNSRTTYQQFTVRHVSRCNHQLKRSCIYRIYTMYNQIQINLKGHYTINNWIKNDFKSLSIEVHKLSNRNVTKHRWMNKAIKRPACVPSRSGNSEEWVERLPHVSKP